MEYFILSFIGSKQSTVVGTIIRQDNASFTIYSASHSSDRHLIFLKFAVNTIQNETCIAF